MRQYAKLISVCCLGHGVARRSELVRCVRVGIPRNAPDIGPVQLLRHPSERRIGSEPELNETGESLWRKWRRRLYV